MLELEKYDYSWLPSDYQLHVAEGIHGYMLTTLSDSTGKTMHVEYIDHVGDTVNKYQPLTASSVIEAFDRLRIAYESSGSSGIFSAIYFVGSYPKKPRTVIMSR